MIEMRLDRVGHSAPIKLGSSSFPAAALVWNLDLYTIMNLSLLPEINEITVSVPVDRRHRIECTVKVVGGS